MGIREEGLNYKGILYFGLILVENFPYVLEFNCRFGDPETQSQLPLLNTDLLDILEAIENNNVDKLQIQWKDKYAVTVILASGGYPENYTTGFEITGLDKVKEALIFHSGTTFKDGKFYTSGGRVLGLTCLGDTVQQARELVYSEIKKVQFENMYYRKDISVDG